MDLIEGYDSDDGKESSLSATPQVEPRASRADRRYLHAAPEISIVTKKKHSHDLIVHRDPTTQSTELAPIQGPAVMDPRTAAKKNGETEVNFKFDEKNFAKQRVKFQRSGQALGPDNNEVVRTTLGYTEQRLEYFRDEDERRRKRPKVDPKEKEPLVYGSDDEVEYGIWAPPSKEERIRSEEMQSDIARVGVDGLAPEQLAERAYIKERDRQRGIEEEEKEGGNKFEQLMERKMSHLLPPKLEDESPAEPKTTFHGTEEHDYKGNAWTAPPAGLSSIASGDGLEMDDHKCFVPKKCVHRFKGHTKGVQRIRLFPKTGHLLLSAGLDGACKIWSVTEKKLMRTYEGHRAAVRDVQFNHDGSRFVSASFDRYLRLWDTESGKALQTFTNEKVPYIVKFYPKDDNFFVVGCSDNKIVTYDCTSAEITQEYNHHLAPVNAIVFVEDNGVKMVTSSDDKKVLVWEWDIGVPIKYISEPGMHSMPCMTLHPSGSFIAAQSLNNHIAVLQAGNRFALQRKKKFTGHTVAGYACDVAFSPDGEIIMSGDGNGKIFFWEWKRSRLVNRYKAHDKGPTIGCVWHPVEPSLVFTCGWDGVIKMWR